MSDQFLELELRLMMIRHGRNRVLAALGRLGPQSVEELEGEIAALGERKAQKKKLRRDRTTAELVEEATRSRPEIQALVIPLVTRFENRTFLPQLKDVVRFLDGVGVPHGKLKSRTASLPTVVVALAQRSAEELRELAAHSPSESGTDFMTLAREIMAGGRPRRQQKGGTQSTDGTR